MKTFRSIGMLSRMNEWKRWPAITALALSVSACSTVVVTEPPGGHPPPPTTPQAGMAPGGYTVSKGDTLYSIAFRNGSDVRTVAGLNNIAPPYTIWPGQVLRLPGRGAPPPPNVVAAPVVAQAPPPPPHNAGGFQSVPAHAPAAPTPLPPPPPPASSSKPVATVVPVAGTPTPPPNAAPPPVATPVVAAAGGTRDAGGIKWRWPANGQVVGKFQGSSAIPGIDIAGKAGDPVTAAADGVVVYSGNGLVGYGELIIIKHNDSLLSAYGHNSKRLVTEGQQVKAGQEIATMGAGAGRDALQFQIRKDGNPVDPLQYLPSK